MFEPEVPPAPPPPVPFVSTGRPLRDWLTWRMANTPAGEPVFPLINEGLRALIPTLFKLFAGLRF
jgi:hypothetical protein